MNTYKTLFVNLMKDESGQDLIEYALIASIIALGCVVAMGAVTTELNTVWTSITTKLTAAAG